MNMEGIAQERGGMSWNRPRVKQGCRAIITITITTTTTITITIIIIIIIIIIITAIRAV
jgi:hypothetical protein